MQHTHLYGSLVIAATTPVRQFPMLEGSKPLHGNHTESRTRGLFTTLETGDRWAADTVALPQRNKYMTVTVAAQSNGQSMHTASLLKRSLEDLDSRFEGSRQLYKLNQLMLEIETPNLCGSYVAVINNTSEHATFSLLSSGTPLYLCGVYDIVNSSVRVVWSTDDTFIDTTRRADPTRYVFYRFPMLLDRPLFIHTQLVCSKWYSWCKVFVGVDGIAKAFNALELFLYKDPSVNSFER